jgi:serine/threonine-protein kinase
MALQVGSRLGHYDVTALIGEGGMGQVYQATDTKLNRQVALKILPEAFAADPDRLARFQREAQVLASLNHPNIAQIHGLEDSEGTKALVLELVEGPTLADRIAQGPIPIDEALPIAKQIAEALEAAHEAGVIHRDLKPANIKLRPDGTVKVLDFGLAKALDTAPEGDPSLSPTLTAAATQMGVIMGTAAYMSPEQARGSVADHRADVWSFGVVLYEMLTGTRLFDGATVSDTLASVLKTEPDWHVLSGDIPASIKKLLRRCLNRDRKDRLQHIGDARVEIKEALTAPATEETAVAPVTQPAGWRQALPWVAGIVLAVVSGLAVWTVTRQESPRVVRFTVAHDEGLHIAPEERDVVISPNGEYIAYLTGSSGFAAERLHVLRLDQLGSEIIVSGGELNWPFFSPDSESVGFFDGTVDSNVLKRVAVRGGPVSTITDQPGNLVSASWGANDTIVFGAAGLGSGLWQVAAVGGEPQQLTTPDAAKGEIRHTWPEILPGGEAVLFTIMTAEETQIAVLSLDTLEYEVVLFGAAFPQYSPTGHLLYGVQGTLWAVGFDVGSMETVGDPVPVQEGVLTKPLGGANFSVSADGSLVYVSGEVGRGPQRSLVWVDREGGEEPILAEPDDYLSVQLSPDGQRVVAEVGLLGGDLVVYDLARDASSPFTVDSASDLYPIWTPDGERIVWTSTREGPLDIFWKLADGTGQEDRLTTSENNQVPFSWSADGQTLVMNELHPETAIDIGVLSMDGDPTIQWLIEGDSNEGYADVSPDGRWMAYVTDESDRYEVWVTPFPNVEDGLWPVSRNGGFAPQWGPDSSELFFQTYDGTIMVVTNETEPPSAQEFLSQ